MSVLPKAIYRFNVIPVKIATAFFTKLEQTILKRIWNHHGRQITPAIWRKGNRLGGITTPDIKLCSKPTAIRTAWPWPRKDTKLMGQKAELRRKSILIRSMIYDKGGENSPWAKDSLFAINVGGKTEQICAKKKKSNKKLDVFLHHRRE